MPAVELNVFATETVVDKTASPRTRWNIADILVLLDCVSRFFSFLVLLMKNATEIHDETTNEPISPIVPNLKNPHNIDSLVFARLWIIFEEPINFR
jgi:hypothetical protein